MISPLRPGIVVAERTGAVGREFHTWLQAIARALHGPFVGQQSSGTVTIRDGEYGIHAKRLTLSGTQRVTVLGSARLVICG